MAAKSGWGSNFQLEIEHNFIKKGKDGLLQMLNAVKQIKNTSEEFERERMICRRPGFRDYMNAVHTAYKNIEILEKLIDFAKTPEMSNGAPGRQSYNLAKKFILPKDKETIIAPEKQCKADKTVVKKEIKRLRLAPEFQKKLEAIIGRNATTSVQPKKGKIRDGHQISMAEKQSTAVLGKKAFNSKLKLKPSGSKKIIGPISRKALQIAERKIPVKTTQPDKAKCASKALSSKKTDPISRRALQMAERKTTAKTPQPEKAKFVSKTKKDQPLPFNKKSVRRH